MRPQGRRARLHQLPLRPDPNHEVLQGGDRRMDCRRQGQPGPLAPGSAVQPGGRGVKWKGGPALSRRPDRLREAACPEAAGDPRPQTLARHMLATLPRPECSTVANPIRTGGGQHEDRSARFRFYSRERVEESRLFDHTLEAVRAHLPAAEAAAPELRAVLRSGFSSFTLFPWRAFPAHPCFLSPPPRP